MPPRLAVLGDDGQELLLHQRIKTRGRLVEHEQFRIVKQRLDQPDLLPVAAGELAERPIEIGLEPLGQQGCAPRPFIPRASAQNLKNSRPVSRESHAKSPGRLPRRARISRLWSRLSSPNRVAVPRVGMEKVEQRSDRRCLAGSVRTEEADRPRPARQQSRPRRSLAPTCTAW